MNTFPLDLLPRLCPFCGNRTIIGHGQRRRQAHDDQHDRIRVRRGVCRPCGKTFTVLPNWLAPSGHFSVPCRQLACEHIAAGDTAEQATPHCKDPARLPGLRQSITKRGLSGAKRKTLEGVADYLYRNRTRMTVKSNADFIDSTNREIFAIRQEIASRLGLVPAILDGEEAYRRAALAAKLYALDQQLAAATDADVITGLRQKRQAIVDLTQAEWNETDARAAKALDTPLDPTRTRQTH